MQERRKRSEGSETVAARDHVGDVVVRLVIERGVAGVTVDDVAERAGIDAETLRQSTGGAVAPLILGAYDAILDDMLERAIAAYGAGPWASGVRRGTAAIFEAAVRDPLAARFVYVEVPAGGRALIDARATRRASWHEAFLAACSVDPTELPSRVNIELFFGAVRQTVESHIRRGRLSDLPRAIEPLIAAFEPPLASFSAGSAAAG